MKQFSLLSLLTFVMTAAPISLAKGTDPLTEHQRQTRDALEAVAKFAERICIPGGSLEVESEVNKLTGTLATLQINTSESFSRRSYVGVLQEELSGLVLDPPSCIRIIINEWKDVFLPPPPPPVFNVVIKSIGPFIDNQNFGPIDGSISSLRLYIDDELVIDKYLDEKFTGSVKLKEGSYIYRFEADISGAGNSLLSLEGECEGNIDITNNSTFKPKVVFESFGLDAAFQECDLSEY